MSDASTKNLKTMPVELRNSVDRKALAIPFVLAAAFLASVVITARWGLTAEISCWVLFVVGLQIWALAERQRVRSEIRKEIERGGCQVIRMESRAFRLGPFSMWNTSRTQHVLRMVVQEPSRRERVVWARWGRRWFWNPATLEMKWED